MIADFPGDVKKKPGGGTRLARPPDVWDNVKKTCQKFSYFGHN
jgi:hypothetical protein